MHFINCRAVLVHLILSSTPVTGTVKIRTGRVGLGSKVAVFADPSQPLRILFSCHFYLFPLPIILHAGESQGLNARVLVPRTPRF